MLVKDLGIHAKIDSHDAIAISAAAVPVSVFFLDKLVQTLLLR